MTKTAGRVGYLYINGLGTGKITTKDKLVRWWWLRAGQTIEHAQVNWYDGTLAEKERQVEETVTAMLQTFEGIAIIGGSAGGSLALIVFSKMRALNVCAVTTHTRVKVGDYVATDRMSLHHRAKLDTPRPSRAFFDSVVKVENSTIPNFTNEGLQRVLNLTQLTDNVVAVELMQIDGSLTHRSFAFGHFGGFLAHLIADRDLIINFAKGQLG